MSDIFFILFIRLFYFHLFGVEKKQELWESVNHIRMY
jgi:hypothetical protein